MIFSKYKSFRLPDNTYQVILFASKKVYGNVLGVHKGVAIDFRSENIVTTWRYILKTHMKILKAGHKLKLNLVDDIDLVVNAGDAIIVIGRENRKQLITCCPQCGETSSSTGKHVYNEETQTYHPLIVHDKKLGGCGWHGWLRNGEFITI